MLNIYLDTSHTYHRYLPLPWFPPNINKFTNIFKLIVNNSNNHSSIGKKDSPKKNTTNIKVTNTMSTIPEQIEQKRMHDLPQVYTVFKYILELGRQGLPKVCESADMVHRRRPWHNCITVSVANDTKQAEFHVGLVEIA